MRENQELLEDRDISKVNSHWIKYRDALFGGFADGLLNRGYIHSHYYGPMDFLKFMGVSPRS